MNDLLGVCAGVLHCLGPLGSFVADESFKLCLRAWREFCAAGGHAFFYFGQGQHGKQILVNLVEYGFGRTGRCQQAYL